MSWRSLNTPGKAAAVILLITVVIVLWQLAAAARSALAVPASPKDAARTVDNDSETYENAFARFVAMTDGRSMFVRPRRPVRRRLPVLPVTTEEKKEEVTEVPRSYNGPAIIALYGDTVWFEDGTRIRAGEEQGDIRVVAVNAPWSADLVWKGGEFTEKLFDRDDSAIPLMEKDSPPATAGENSKQADGPENAAQPRETSKEKD